MSLDVSWPHPLANKIGSFLAAPVFLCTRLRHLQRSATSHATTPNPLQYFVRYFATEWNRTAESLWDFQKCQKCQKCPICDLALCPRKFVGSRFQASNMSWSWSPKREAHWIKGFRSMPSLEAKTENSGWSFHGKNMKSSWETQKIHGNACSSHKCVINRLRWLRHSTHSYPVDLQRLMINVHIIKHIKKNNSRFEVWSIHIQDMFIS